MNRTRSRPVLPENRQAPNARLRPSTTPPSDARAHSTSLSVRSPRLPASSFRMLSARVTPSSTALSAGGQRRLRSGHGDDVDRADVRVGGQQLAGDLPNRRGDLTLEMGLAGVLGLEAVEHAVGCVRELERVPGDASLLGCGERTPCFRNAASSIAFARLGLQRHQRSEFDHRHPFPFARASMRRVVVDISSIRRSRTASRPLTRSATYRRGRARG